MIVTVAILAFAAINVCIWYGANAAESANTEGQDITREGVKVVDRDKSFYYRFSQKDGNLGEWELNAENATYKKPTKKEEIMWWNDHIGNERPALLYDDPDKVPSCSDDFVYHHDDRHYEMYNIHFCIPAKVYHKHDATCTEYSNRITLQYHTATPYDSRTNKFKFLMEVDLMPDGQNVEKTIHMWDKITDGVDSLGRSDSDFFGNAGYNDDYGDSMKDALEFVGEPSLYQAVKDHKMVVRIVELRFWP